LLGNVLALRVDKSYDQLVRERICEPLALADTRVSIPPDALARFASGHDRRGREVPHWDVPALAGAGALRSTVADLLGFLDLQFQQPTTRLARAARATQEPRARRGRLTQCLGWASLPLLGHSVNVLWHNGGTDGFRGFVGFVRESGTGVVVLSNCARSVDAIGFQTLEAIDWERTCVRSGNVMRHSRQRVPGIVTQATSGYRYALTRVRAEKALARRCGRPRSVCRALSPSPGLGGVPDAFRRNLPGSLSRAEALRH
jgi:CubicO group peptidase (beta-lactamase class C family)